MGRERCPEVQPVLEFRPTKSRESHKYQCDFLSQGFLLESQRGVKGFLRMKVVFFQISNILECGLYPAKSASCAASNIVSHIIAHFQGGLPAGDYKP